MIGPQKREGADPPSKGSAPWCDNDREDTAQPTEGYHPVTITPAHRRLLLDSAITEEVIDASGIKSTSNGIYFPWSDGVTPTIWQQRPDKPREGANGKPMKYVFPTGAKVPFNRLRDSDSTTRLVIAEGTKQQYAVLSHAPADFGVYGMSGCWGFKRADLTVANGRDVFLLLDADFTTNVDVYAAAEQMSRQLKKHGAKSVRFVSTTGTGKEGVDDTLAGFPEGRRAEMLKLWLSQATDKLGKRPAPKQPEDGSADLFRTRSKPIAYQPMDAAMKVQEAQPAALTAEGNIALYKDGVYQVDRTAILSTVVKLLGNYYSPGYLKQTTDVLTGLLAAEGKNLPERASGPLLNCTNTMVDLRTGQKVPHSPDHMSSVQVTVAYEEDAACPVYEAWLREAVRQEGHTEDDVERIIAGLEEVAGTMLDPSRTPSKALFLFGPSRSGKSTFLRLLKAIAGAPNTSAVTLHDLANDQFARANLYSKMLNVAADLSNKHVGDLSTFKMVLGEDVINGNRKYGQQFTFTNQALVAFSANELPTVSEASRAYVERVWPVAFPNSFAGREDKSLEDKLMAELPGILVRWAKAYSRMLARGGYATPDSTTRGEFEAKSDRVVQFLQDMCTVTPAAFGERLDAKQCTGRRKVAQAFNEWAERNGSSSMGERAFFQRLASIEGVVEVRTNGNSARAFNVTVAAADDDSWEDADVPQADPIDPSGVIAQDIAANPWTAPEAPSTACPVPAATATVNGAQTATQNGSEPHGVTLQQPDPFAVGGVDYFA